MIENKKTHEVIDKFFEAIKAEKDYKIEATNLTFNMTLDLIKETIYDSINKNPESFQNLVSWILVASMYLLDDIEELDEIDLQLRGAI
jgi:hypothetical protein|tara:strand:- start:2956 stop:3219 length:264 start_codon:yes stop_codon:yes gene_type:complete